MVKELGKDALKAFRIDKSSVDKVPAQVQQRPGVAVWLKTSDRQFQFVGVLNGHRSSLVDPHEIFNDKEVESLSKTRFTNVIFEDEGQTPMQIMDSWPLLQPRQLPFWSGEVIFESFARHDVGSSSTTSATTTFSPALTTTCPPTSTTYQPTSTWNTTFTTSHAPSTPSPPPTQPWSNPGSIMKSADDVHRLCKAASAMQQPLQVQCPVDKADGSDQQVPPCRKHVTFGEVQTHELHSQPHHSARPTCVGHSPPSSSSLSQGGSTQEDQRVQQGLAMAGQLGYGGPATKATAEDTHGKAGSSLAKNDSDDHQYVPRDPSPKCLRLLDQPQQEDHGGCTQDQAQGREETSWKLKDSTWHRATLESLRSLQDLAARTWQLCSRRRQAEAERSERKVLVDLPQLWQSDGRAHV